MLEELKQARTSKFDMISMLVSNGWFCLMTSWIPRRWTTPKPHLLLIGIPSLVSTSRLMTQSIILKAFLSELSMTLNNCNNNWTLGKLSRTHTPVLNSQGNIREDYLPHDIHLSKFGAQVVGSTINRLLKQIIRSIQPKSQFRFLKFPFP